MSNDSLSGLQSGMRGDLIAPSSAEGMAGYMAGQQLSRTRTSGSIEWLVAPVVLAPLFACFYPVTTAATLATAFAAEAAANAFGVAATGFTRFFVLLIPTVIVCWTVGRRDQIWGLNPTYYLIRHVTRLLTFAALINAATMNGRIPEGSRTVGAFFANITSSPSVIVAILLAVGFWQWLFMTGYQTKLYWNMKLIAWRFRKKDFPPIYFHWSKTPPVIQNRRDMAVPDFVQRAAQQSAARRAQEDNQV